MAAADAPTREVRLALVLNGGVSLAVWIGGVTREIDAARRGVEEGEHDTAAVYGAINAALQQTAVVDVIGGASAGGINGVLLAAAVYNGVPLGDLRETWISIGDFRTLLRSQSESDPPSLMRGDDVVLPQLGTELRRLWRPSPHPANPRLYLYVTATDLFGYARRFEDTGGREFQETDHRRVFRFEHDDDHNVADDDGGPDRVLRDLVPFSSPDAQSLLAHAARASASFPVAFEPHLHKVRDPDGKWPQHALIDGGILDNQPFNPVLDRVSVLRAELPTKRVVVYVVPYVTEVGTTIESHTATARDTLAAANTLPRDLPKLQGLERVTQQVRRQRSAMAERAEALRTVGVEERARLAAPLLTAYRRTRLDASLRVFASWADPRFRPGNGTIAQHPSQEPEDVLPLVAPPPEVPGHVRWIPDDGQVRWSAETGEPWSWGLSPAERVAAWALIALRFDPGRRRDVGTREVALQERVLASGLIDDVRALKVQLRRTFVAQLGSTDERRPTSRPAGQLLDLAMSAYEAIDDQLRNLQTRFVELDHRLRETVPGGVEGLLHLEVVRNATAIHEESVSFPFHFLLASAGVTNSLGHPARTPEEKLAGMKLGHFGGFLKRSWRTNDWLWGRMDGVEHVVRALVDADRIGELPDSHHAGAQLAHVAFGRRPATDTATKRELAARWQSDLDGSGLEVAEPTPSQSFQRVVEIAASPPSPEEGEMALALLRRALARPAQLRVLRADLSRAAETARDDVAGGASRTTTGAFWSNAFPADPAAASSGELVRLFQTMQIGSESLRQEAGSRLVLDVGAQTVAVAAALFAGKRGGLPAAARSLLASIRATTLSASRLVQLVAREPWVGATVFALLVGLVVWAGLSHSTLVGAIFPGLTLTAIVVGLSLFTIATGTLETPRGGPRQSWAWRIALVFSAGVPAAYAVVALVLRLHELAPSWPHWLDARMGVWASVGVGVAAVAATALAVVVAVGRFMPEAGWRRWALAAYRTIVPLALAAAGAGVAFERWQHPPGGGSAWAQVADDHRGAVLVLLLLVVLAAAAAVEISVAQVRRRGPAPPP